MTDARISPAKGSNVRDAAIPAGLVDAILDDFAARPAKERSLATVLPMRTKPRIGWAETYIANITGARAYLETRGFAVIRLDTDRHSGDCWMVSGWAGAITNEDLVAYAVTLGFEAAK